MLLRIIKKCHKVKGQLIPISTLHDDKESSPSAPQRLKITVSKRYNNKKGSAPNDSWRNKYHKISIPVIKIASQAEILKLEH